MNALMVLHVAGGATALAAGAVAAMAPKGRAVHVAAGRVFVGGMLARGLGASLLDMPKVPAESPAGGLSIVYFVLTGWAAMRARRWRTRVAEAVGGVFVFAIAVGAALEALAMLRGEVVVDGPPGPITTLAFAAICALAGGGDLRWARLRSPTATQRRRRHGTRLAVAFFMATGAFFLGQQDVMPLAWRGSAWWFVPAMAPWALLPVAWFVRDHRLPRAATQLPSV